MSRDVIERLRELLKSVELEGALREMSDREVADLLDRSMAGIDMLDPVDALLGVLTERLRRAGQGRLPELAPKATVSRLKH